MKAVRLFALVAAVGVLAWVVPATATPGFAGSAPPPSQRQMDRQQQAQQAEQGQVFRGVLMLQNGNYILRSEDGKTAYKLDHQDVLKKHDLDKKRVSVVGNLDPSSNTIHITKVILMPAGR